MARKNANVLRPPVLAKELTTFTTEQGRRLRVAHTDGWGNRHFNVRRPQGPTCADCGATWEPLCSTKGCPARRTVLAIRRAELEREEEVKRYGHRHGEHYAKKASNSRSSQYDQSKNTRSQGGSRRVRRQQVVDVRVVVQATEMEESAGALAQAFKRAAGRAA